MRPAPLTLTLVLAACPGDPGGRPTSTAVEQTTGDVTGGAGSSSGVDPSTPTSDPSPTSDPNPTSGPMSTSGGTTCPVDDTTAAGDESTGEDIPPCPADVICVDKFPYTDMRDTN